MRKNKAVACVLTAAMVITGVTLDGSGWSTVAAEAAEAGYTFTYENFGCTYLEDGTIEISKYNGSDAEVVIPQEIDGAAVTAIGDGAFVGCSSLTSIELPEGVTSIGSQAFEDCSSLTSIELPDSVTSIGDWAFSGCSSLTSIELPDSVTSIGDWAFSGCSSLTSIELPDSVTSIGGYAFWNCSSLTSIELPDSVTSIGYRAFCSCSSLTSIEVALENENYSSQDGILYDKNKTELICCPERKGGEVIIPDSVTSIRSSAFYGCSSLTSIELPEGVTSIGSQAFEDCSSLTSIELPDSVTSIGDSAFEGCSSLTSIELPEGVGCIGDRTFSGCSSLTSIKLPDSVTFIYDGAFSGCSSLTSIKLPDSVTFIILDAFDGCSSLTSIEVALENKNYSSQDGILYNKNRTKLIRCPEGKEGEVIIPDSVTIIGDSAFYGCNSLTSIKLPDSVTVIRNSAFWYCSSLTSIEVALENKNYSSQDGILYNKNRTELIYCPKGKEGEVIIPNGVTSIRGSAFSVCSSLTSIELPEGVTSIGDSAFSSCSSLTSIELPDSVTSIGYCAFSGCSSLTSIELPDSVTSIEWAAFFDCSLTEVTIPASVMEIGNRAFGYYYDWDLPIEGFTIYGCTGTAAETYALENDFTFIALDKITLGDVNEDGSIDYFDAMAVLQYDAELIELTDIQLLAGDVNHDGSVDSFDAVKILQYDAELIESFK